MESQVDGLSRLRGCLGSRTDEAGNHDRRSVSTLPAHLGRKLEDRTVQSNPWIVNRELGGVDADGNTTGSRREVIPGQCPLMPFIQPSIWIEGERVCRDDRSAPQGGAHVLRKTLRAHVNESSSGGLTVESRRVKARV